MARDKTTVVKPDRGTVKRITFELLYPNGQLKQVQIENNSATDWGEISLIVFDKHAVGTLLNGSELAGDFVSKWNALDGEGPYPPAMLVVNTEGKIQPFCGRHKQLSPVQQ